MVTFDAAQAGTSEQTWAADSRLGDRPTLFLGDADEVVVIAAHPDDETLGAGGLIAHCADVGVPVRVVCVTDGAASHAADPRTAQRRADELAAAVGHLHPDASIEMLDFPDGQTSEHRAAIKRAVLSSLDVSEHAVLVAPWRGDGHRDHRIVGEIAAEVAGGRLLLEYPIWMWHWGSPNQADIPWDRMVALSIEPAEKLRAIECFESQTNGEQPVLRAEFLEHFRRTQEIFITGDRVLGQAYFDAVYAKSDDPWRFGTRWYEERKRDITVSALPHERYQRGLEIGCSIGLLTELLAARCDHLLAVDLSEAAVAQARELVESRVSIRAQDVRAEFPEGEFDLIVLSEIGYYWGAPGLHAILRKVHAGLAPRGVLIACHWRHPVAEYPLTGDDVHEAIAAHDWTRIVHHLEEDFVLEVFSKDARSVARQEGLL